MAQESEHKVPSDLIKALMTIPKAKEKWDEITPVARRDFITWIEGAKQPETRIRRIGIACEKLIRGDRRPCCYAVIPMDLYKALGNNSQAKAAWKNLSPNERRDVVSWVDEVDSKEATKQRIEEVMRMLETSVH